MKAAWYEEQGPARQSRRRMHSFSTKTVQYGTVSLLARRHSALSDLPESDSKYLRRL
jgi:hypothetical protein